MEASVDIDVKELTSPDNRLQITLTNRSSEPVETYEHALPWVGQYSILLIAAKTDAAGTILQKNLPVDDPGPATTTIQPGGTLTGEILLANRFPEFLQALKERDIVVFWSYQFQRVDGVPTQRVGGSVTFSKLPDSKSMETESKPGRVEFKG
jgi:hypothetical protein